MQKDEWGNVINQAGMMGKSTSPKTTVTTIKAIRICIGIFCLAMAFYVSPFYDKLIGDLPECDAPEVQKMLTNIYPLSTLKDIEQYNNEKLKGIRYCRVTADGHISSFTISWYGDKHDKFVVKKDM